MNAAAAPSLDANQGGLHQDKNDEFLAERSNEETSAASLYISVAAPPVMPSDPSQGIHTTASPLPPGTSPAALRRVRDALFHARDADVNNAWVSVLIALIALCRF
jgi:hypothetical protein